MPDETDMTSTLSPKEDSRKTYSTPVLVEYGDIRELTKATNPPGKVADQALPGNKST